ncbi:hypothetical protein ACIBLA_32415 [Streptomyces sp. NPDC050433]|uniref:hypothetical protein n=1 Tax=unclassified Streptomyces TaxID=2593676 RepID=UPI00343FD502
MTRSESRKLLSQLSEAIGVDGVVVVRKAEPGAEGADLGPGSVLAWPPCECGHPKCPDYKSGSGAEELRSRVAERNGLSRRDEGE